MKAENVKRVGRYDPPVLIGSQQFAAASTVGSHPHPNGFLQHHLGLRRQFMSANVSGRIIRATNFLVQVLRVLPVADARCDKASRDDRLVREFGCLSIK